MTEPKKTMIIINGPEMTGKTTLVNLLRDCAGLLYPLCLKPEWNPRRSELFGWREFEKNFRGLVKWTSFVTVEGTDLNQSTLDAIIALGAELGFTNPVVIETRFNPNLLRPETALLMVTKKR